MADLVMVSSHFLEDKVGKVNENTVRILTSADTDFYRSLDSRGTKDRLVVGWLGTADNVRHLSIIKPVLQRLQKEFDLEYRFISDVDKIKGRVEDLGLDRVELIQWDLSSVNKELNRFDVGISPLYYSGDENARTFADGSEVYLNYHWIMGKSAQRDREYMAAGIPVVSSDLGEIRHSIKDGENGFLASTEEEWHKKLEALLTSPSLRERIGIQARKTCEEQLSSSLQGERFKEALEGLLRNR